MINIDFIIIFLRLNNKRYISAIVYSTTMTILYLIFIFKILNLSSLPWVWPPWLHSMLIIGWFGSNPRTAAMGSLDYVSFYLGLCAAFSRPLMALVPPSLPPPISPRNELHVYSQFSRACISISSSCLLSVRLSFIPPPPSSASCHPPSSRMTDWRSVPCC